MLVLSCVNSLLVIGARYWRNLASIYYGYYWLCVLLQTCRTLEKWHQILVQPLPVPLLSLSNCQKKGGRAEKHQRGKVEITITWFINVCKDIARSEVEGKFFLPVLTCKNDGVLVCTKCTLHCEQHNVHLASFSALEHECVYIERVWYLFSWCNQNGTKVFQKQHFARCSITYVFNARLDMCCKLSATFMFWTFGCN